MKKEKEITLNDLALMVGKGFNKMDERFEKVEKRLGNVEGDIHDMKNKIEQIDRRLFSIEEDVADIKIKQYGNLNKRVGFIERKLGIAGAR